MGSGADGGRGHAVSLSRCLPLPCLAHLHVVCTVPCKFMSAVFCTVIKVLLSSLQSSVYLAVQILSEVSRAASDVLPVVVGRVD